MIKEKLLLHGQCMCGNASWTHSGDVASVTACNCTLCRRYGVLWAYGFAGEQIAIDGNVALFERSDKPIPSTEFVFCPHCACVVGWRRKRTEPDGRRRMAVNVRLAPPEAVANLPVEHLDGLNTFEPLESDGRCVRDMWF